MPVTTQGKGPLPFAAKAIAHGGPVEGFAEGDHPGIPHPVLLPPPCSNSHPSVLTHEQFGQTSTFLQRAVRALFPKGNYPFVLGITSPIQIPVVQARRLVSNADRKSTSRV